MIIRYATVADAKKISRLWMQLCEETDQNKTPDIDWFRRMLINRMQEKDFVVLVADEGGKIVGFVTAYAYTNTETGKKHGQSPHIYVEPEYRGREISKRLYTGIIDEARKRDCVIYEHFCDESTRDYWIKKGYRVAKYLMAKEV